MRQAFGFAFLVFLNACSSHENVPLIRQYEVVWEANLLERYAENDPLPYQLPFFSDAFINPNGSIYIIHASADYSDTTTLTLLDEAGTFVNDVTLPGEYVFNVSANRAGFMLTLSRKENNYVIKLWNENLNSTELKILPQPAYFPSFYHKRRFLLRNSAEYC